MRCLTLWDVVADSYFCHPIFFSPLFLQLRCRIFTIRMSDFHNSDVGFPQLGCRILTTRMSDFYNSDVGFLQFGCRIFTTRMSDCHKSDVGFSQLGCRIFTTQMSDLTTQISDFHKSDFGFSTTQMAPISFRNARLAVQKQSFLFSRDSSWPPSDKGLLRRIFRLGRAIGLLCENSQYSLFILARKHEKMYIFFVKS